MEYIIITFRFENMQEMELKLPAFVKVADILSMISDSFNIILTDKSRMQAEPIGRILDNNKTLDEEGVGAGALLTLI